MKNEVLFQKFMVAISEIFGRKLTRATMDVYWQALKNYSDEQCTVGFEYVIKFCKYFPKPADIIEAIENTVPQCPLSPTEARMQIENWLYNGAPEPKDPIVQEIITSYGGWERLGMTNYNDLKFLLRDIEARFEAIAGANGSHSYLPGMTSALPNSQWQPSTDTATSLTSDHFSPLKDTLKEGLSTLASQSHLPIVREGPQQ